MSVTVASSSAVSLARSTPARWRRISGINRANSGTRIGHSRKIDEVAAPRFVEPDRHLIAAPLRLEARAPPRARRNRHDLLHRHVRESPLLERCHDEIALPGEIGLARHMLERAAAAGAEMDAGRRGPRRALLDQLDEMAPLALTFHANNVAWNRARNEQSVRGHPVAGVAELHDFDDFAEASRLLGHSATSYSQVLGSIGTGHRIMGRRMQRDGDRARTT